MKYWLMKSEPSVYGWDDLVKDKRTSWSGVRNHQASNNMKAMQQGDRAFFYHSNEGLAVVGIMEICRLYYPDPSDEAGKFGMVDVKPVMPLKTPVTLAQIKAEPRLAGIPLVRQSRLSVMPIDDKSWRLICEMGGVKP